MAPTCRPFHTDAENYVWPNTDTPWHICRIPRIYSCQYGHVLIVDMNRLQFAGIHAAVRQTPSAQIRNHITGLRTFVAGDIDDLDDVRILPAAADSQPYTFSDYRPILIDTASLRRLVFRNDLAGNLIKFREHIVALPCLNRHLAENVIFNFLHLIIE